MATDIILTADAGDCAELGSSSAGLAGDGCARLMYVGGGILASQEPFESVEITLNPYLNDQANMTSIFIDDVSYETHLLDV